MNNLKIGVALFSSLTASLVATNAWAACIQSDAIGNWNLYITKQEGDWIRCPRISINASGNLLSGTACVAADGDRATVTGGNIKLSTNCVATGSILFGGATVTIKHATFDKSKNYFTGVGTAPGDLPNEPASFNAVKL